MRAFAILVGLLATLAGTYAGFVVMRAVGPDDRSGEFGYGDAALAPPGGGTLLQSKNFPLVIKALERELGPTGGVQYLNVELTHVSGTGIRGDGREVSLQIDAAGRSQATETGSENRLVATVPVARLDPAALDRMTAAARKQTGEPVEELTLQGGQREWRIDMLRGEPDSFIANLDGGGLRLSGEENPEPVGASKDSMLRAENLQKVLDQVAEEGDEVLDFDIRPERVAFQLKKGGRTLQLSFGYDAQLTGRDISATTGEARTVKLTKIDPQAIEQLARHPKVKGLKNIQYVLLSPPDVFSSKPTLSTYLAKDSDPTYVVCDLHGRHITWPGRG